MLPSLTEDVQSLHHFGRQRPIQSRHQQNNGIAKRLLRKNRKQNFTLKNLNAVPSDGAGVKTPKLNSNYADGAFTTIPVPIPDTRARPAVVRYTTTRNGSTEIVTLTSKPAISTAFTPLPPLLSASATTPVWLVPSPLSTLTVTVSPSLSPTRASAVQTHAQRANPRALPTAVIVLLAVGSAFVLLGGFIIFRACSRPRKRKHPTPSLPILDAEFSDHFAIEDSPLFGGKERYSSDPPDSGVAWASYQQTPQVATTYTAAAEKRVQFDIQDTGPGPQAVQEQAAESRDKVVVPTEPSFQNAIQQAHSALNLVASRLSATSTFLYPHSPLSPHDVGIAMDGSPSLTADGHTILKRTKSKGSMQRDRRSLGPRDTTSWRYSQALAYDIASPMQASQSIPAIAVTASGGRSRIKSTYFAPGAYPRLSSNVPLPSLSTSQPPGGLSARELAPSALSSHDVDVSSRRDRETRALTNALGLRSPSPPPPSPQPTIYPEDSLSRRPSIKTSASRNHKKPASRATTTEQVLMSPSTETNTALGSLMLMDFGATSKTISSLGYLNEPPTPSVSASSMAGLTKSKKTDDKPPRVPSPPPLPSLAQMALAHANPEGYADYRSPTYSIYGLYQPERKSRVTSFGY
jgi:hypothetical protein